MRVNFCNFAHCEILTISIHITWRNELQPLFFRSDTNPNPVDIANFEEIFEARGARKCWVPGRLTSPLALHYAFPANYERYCLTKTKVDRNLMLNSGYMQGTILTCPPKRSVSMN